MNDNKNNLLSALDFIDPANCNYGEWLEIGMAAKEEGLPCSVWDDWSSRDPGRYHPGECEQKWNSFHGDGAKVTGGTIIQMAKDRGWHYEGSIKKAEVERKPSDQLILYLETLFDPGDIIAYTTGDCWKKKDGKWAPGKGVFNRTAGDLIEDLKRHPDDISASVGKWNPAAGAWIRMNPLDGKGVADKNVIAFHFALVESDEMPIPDQEKLYRDLELPIVALVQSGGRSLHAVTHIDAKDPEEYAKRVNFLFGYLEKHGLTIDPVNKNPSRLSRMPGITRGDKLQKLVATNIGRESWADWYQQAASEKKAVHLISLNNVEEKEAEYLIPEYIPKGQITSVVGEGGVGKTFDVCAIAAAISTGKLSFMNNNIPSDWCDYGPQKVAIFSAEDSLSYTLRKRLRKNGANLENIFSIDISDEQFKDVKFNNDFLETIIKEINPALVIFDPIQAFVQADIHMGDRNAMRNNLEPLIGYGEKYGTTFLIIVHANKQANVWGRKRMADSADIWDISRSVLMAGTTEEKGVYYLSHEKNNYGPTGSTVLYSIEDEVVRFKGYTDKKDRDFVMARQYDNPSPARDEATDFILEYLADGEKAVSDLDDSAKAIGISSRTLKRAKSDLKKDRQIGYRATGQGKEKKYFVYLL